MLETNDDIAFYYVDSDQINADKVKIADKVLKIASETNKDYNIEYGDNKQLIKVPKDKFEISK